MGKYKSIWTGPQIDEGVGAARNPDTVPTSGSDALITSDAVEKVQQGFAPIESDATASQAYAIGDLLVWGGSLYKAKTAIAVNDSFTVGTNIEATTIADKLNNIDTEITPDTDTTINGLFKGNGSKVAQAVGDTDYATPAAVTSTRQMLAPILADPAGQAVSAGDFFIYNGVLRKALQAITSAMTAATFTGATYSEAVSNGGLNELKSAFTPKLWYSDTFTANALPTVALPTGWKVLYVTIFVGASWLGFNFAIDRNGLWNTGNTYDCAFTNGFYMSNTSYGRATIHVEPDGSALIINDANDRSTANKGGKLVISYI